MRYSVPASYARFIEASIVLAIAEAAKDADVRTDEDPRIRAWASVPDHLIDATARGTAIVVIDVAEQPVAAPSLVRVA